ncbi:MAG: TPM domain-containing protein, partial [Nitrospiria bacterium]
MHGKPLCCLVTGLTLFILLLPARLFGEVTVPDPGRFVIDKAGLIDAGTEQQIEGWLRELEQKTTAQVKVLTVQTTDGEDFFGFVQRHAELWKLGQVKKDNGALIVLALKERQVRIHTGYGLEGVLPDSWAGSASRSAAGQFFKQGQFSEGLYRLTIAVANKVADAERIQLSGIPAFRYRAPRRLSPRGSLFGGILPLLIMFFLFSSMTRR